MRNIALSTWILAAIFLVLVATLGLLTLGQALDKGTEVQATVWHQIIADPNRIVGPPHSPGITLPRQALVAILLLTTLAVGWRLLSRLRSVAHQHAASKRS